MLNWRWSCRLPPTPGLSICSLMPCSRMWDAGPTPDSINSCGVPIAPVQTITSRSARTTSCPVRAGIRRPRRPVLRTGCAAPWPRFRSTGCGRLQAGLRKACGGAPAETVLLSEVDGARAFALLPRLRSPIHLMPSARPPCGRYPAPATSAARGLDPQQSAAGAVHIVGAPLEILVRLEVTQRGRPSPSR